MTAERRIPTGTEVVVRDSSAETTARGAVGRVIRDRGATYAVVLADGRVLDVPPDGLTAVRDLSPENESPASQADPAALVTRHTIYAAVVPPVAPGFAGPDGEVTVRGVYQAPTSAFWSSAKPPLNVDGPSPGWSSWEVERFCALALEANPSCLELLWAGHAVWVTEVGRELLDLRGAFLSQLVAPVYSEHALTAFKELDQSENATDERWASAAYQLRLLIDGAALLRTGDIPATASVEQERLKSVRAGHEPWDAVDTWRQELQKKLEEAAIATFLPSLPDVGRVDSWLSHVRGRDLQDQPSPT